MSSAQESSVNDDQALSPEQLIAEYQTGIWRYLRALGCEAAEAEDLTQDTFLAVLQKPFEQYGKSATAAYLRRVAYNRFITNRRKSGLVVLSEQVEEIDRVWQQLASDDHGDAMSLERRKTSRVRSTPPELELDWLVK